MENPKYILLMRQVASDFDGISHELFQIANDLERIDQFNPQQKLFGLVRGAEVSTVSLRNLTARTVHDDVAPFYSEVADLLGIKIEESHDWIKITVPAILPKRNQRDNQAFLTRPLRYALLDFLKENPMERFGACAICIVHQYDEALGIRRIRDYDNIETKRYHPPRTPNREYDAIDVLLDRPVILNYQCDLLKLSDITPMPGGFRGSPIMLCFDYQAQTVQGIVGPSIEVRPVESVIYYGQKKTENSS